MQLVIIDHFPLPTSPNFSHLSPLLSSTLLCSPLLSSQKVFVIKHKFEMQSHTYSINSNNNNITTKIMSSLHDIESYRDLLPNEAEYELEDLLPYLESVLKQEQEDTSSSSSSPRPDAASDFDYDVSRVVVLGNLPMPLALKTVGQAKSKISQFILASLKVLGPDYAHMIENWNESNMMIPTHGDIVAQCVLLQCESKEDSQLMLDKDGKLELALGPKKSFISIRPYSDIVDAFKQKVVVEDDHINRFENSMFFMDNGVNPTSNIPQHKINKFPLGMYSANIKGESSTEIYSMAAASMRMLERGTKHVWSKSGKYLAYYLEEKGGVKIVFGNNFSEGCKITGLRNDELEADHMFGKHRTHEVSSVQFSTCECFVILQIQSNERDVPENEGFTYLVYRIYDPATQTHFKDGLLIKECRPSDAHLRLFNPLERDNLAIFSVYSDTDKLSSIAALAEVGTKSSSRTKGGQHKNAVEKKDIEVSIMEWNDYKKEMKPVNKPLTIRADTTVEKIINEMFTSSFFNRGVSEDSIRLQNNRKDLRMDMTYEELEKSMTSIVDEKVEIAISLSARTVKRMEICAKIIDVEIDEKRGKPTFIVFNGKEKYLVESLHGVSKDYRFLNNGMPKFSFDGRFMAQIARPGFLSIFEVKDGFKTLLHSASHLVENIVDFQWSPAPFLRDKKGVKTDATVSPSGDLPLSAYQLSYWSPEFGGTPGRFCVVNLEKSLTSNLTVVSSCSINSDCIIQGDIYWQNEGDYVALVVLDFKSKINSVMFCRVCEDKSPTDKLPDIKLNAENDGIISFSWEPFSHRFLIQLPNEAQNKYNYYLYQMRTPIKEPLKEDAKSKDYTFTISNYTAQDKENIKKEPFKYVVYQEVKASAKDKQPSIRGYVQIGNPTAFEAFKRGFQQRAKFEDAKGTPLDNRANCTKDEDRLAKTEVFEKGDIPQAGERSKKFELVFKNNVCLISQLEGSKYGHNRKNSRRGGVAGWDLGEDWESVYWSPMGKYLALTNSFDSKQASVKFFEVDDNLVSVPASNRMLPVGLKEITDVEPPAFKRGDASNDITQSMKISWDASGQMLACVYIVKNANIMDRIDNINFYSFQGRLLENSTIKFPSGHGAPIRLFLWRPSIDNMDTRRIRKFLSTPGQGKETFDRYIAEFVAEEDAVERKNKAVKFASRKVYISKFLSALKANDRYVKSEDILAKQSRARPGFREEYSLL